MEANIASREDIVVPMTEHLDRVARIQQAWARKRPDIDVSPQGVIGRLHRLAGHLTEQLCVVYRRHGLSEGEFDVLATLRRAGRTVRLSARRTGRVHHGHHGRHDQAHRPAGARRPGHPPAEHGGRPRAGGRPDPGPAGDGSTGPSPSTWPTSAACSTTPRRPGGRRRAGVAADQVARLLRDSANRPVPGADPQEF